MARKPGSLRWEAEQRGVTVAQVRADRAEARGISKAVALGHASRTGERGLAPPRHVRDYLGDVESVKFRRGQGPNNDQTVVMKYSKDGGLDPPEYLPDDLWDDYYDWFDWFDIDWEEYQ